VKIEQLSKTIDGPNMIANSIDADQLVPLRTPHDGTNRRNFVKSVACEFKFPTMLGLAESTPSKPFVDALRKKFPHYELVKEMQIQVGERAFPEAMGHAVRSPDRTCSITLKKEAVVLEATKYSFYRDLRPSIEQMLKAVIPIIDSEVFTRVGLRYVNVVPVGPSDDLTDWVNPTLSGITKQGFQGFSELQGRFRLSVENGGCLLQHGMKLKSPIAELTSSPTPDYVLDIDCYREGDIGCAGALAVVDKLRVQANSLFEWCLSSKALGYLRGD
jgi:uncharacterized protein (TIGR04255 family)